MIDEYNKLPEEIWSPPKENSSLKVDEFSGGSVLNSSVSTTSISSGNNKLFKRQRKKILGMLTSAAMGVVMVTSAAGSLAFKPATTVAEPESQLVCPDCGGTGRDSHHPCDTCRGTGAYWVKDKQQAYSDNANVGKNNDNKSQLQFPNDGNSKAETPKSETQKADTQKTGTQKNDIQKNETPKDISKDTSKPTETTSATEAGVCEDCFGTGICLGCHGNTYVECEFIDYSCAKCHRTGVKVCEECGGNGICANCGGSGVGELQGKSQMCGKCHGMGVVCPNPDTCNGTVVVECRACNHTGHKDDGSPCGWCQGTLRHLCPFFEEHYSCDECQGKGYKLLSQN